MEKYVPYLALFVSFCSMAIAFFSYWRTRNFQDYEYAPRIQVLDEKIVCGSNSLPSRPAFSYSAVLENRGLKPIKIDCVRIDYGDALDQSKRMKYHAEGNIYLSPNQSHKVARDVSWTEVENMKKRFNINQCHFFLHIAYFDSKNKKIERNRELTGYDGSTTVFKVPKGDCLT